ncbi:MULTISPECIES: FadR/GntR family transcriptional regulator [Protofrankia]|uniref:GntR domain protein n=1 Tax=Candidatus Protofrankia datiscae TaxID=2716812 RepID=F8AXF4_9ACTN|nr:MULTISPECIES: FCD domain-containing protein [Protofrankia]AEH09434.1 GntR domain protein [Candidatus Protofrankia datiscae]
MADALKKDRSAIRLAPMEVPKASDVLANELRERILTGEFTEDTPLPPERELVTQTRMSRSTVREALRILEVQGLVRIKAGRAGGAFVQRPSKDAVETSVSLVIRGQQIRLAALLETREAIEPFCAQLAARYRTEDDLKALDAANEAITDTGSTLAAFLQANVDWHVGVATASHNELLIGLMTALSRAIYTATENERFINDEVRRLTAKAHVSITRAIRARDPEAAVRRMNRHVHSYAQAVLEVEERTEISVPNGT